MAGAELWLLIWSLVAAVHGAHIRLNGVDDAISFGPPGSRAIFKGSCETDTPSVRALSPTAVNFTGWAGTTPSINFTVELSNVPLTCINVPIGQPCVAHDSDPDLAPPLFFCEFTSPAGQFVHGPLAAYSHRVRAGTESDGIDLGMVARLNCSLPWYATPAQMSPAHLGANKSFSEVNLRVRYFAPDGPDSQDVPYSGVPSRDTVRLYGFPAVLDLEAVSGQRGLTIRSGFAAGNYAYFLDSQVPGRTRNQGMVIFRMDDPILEPSSILTLNLANVDPDMVGGFTCFSSGTFGYAVATQRSVPGQTTHGYSGKIARFGLSTFDEANVVVLDLEAVDLELTGFRSSFAVGGFAYLASYRRNDESGAAVANSNIVRIDLSTFTASGVTRLDLAMVDPGLTGLLSCFSGGNGYGYFVSYHDATRYTAVVVRVDLSNFSPTGVTFIDVAVVDSGATAYYNSFSGGDGYGYLVPYRHGKVARFPLLDFSTSNIEILNLGLISSLYKGFFSGFSRAGYSYFVPYNNGRYFSTLVRIRQSDFSASGVETIDLSTSISDVKAVGFAASVVSAISSDAYLVPNFETSEMVAGDSRAQGAITLSDHVIKVDLNTFSAVDVSAIDLRPATNAPRIFSGYRGCFAADGVAYFVPYSNVASFGDLLRVDLNDFSSSQISVLNLTQAVNSTVQGFIGGFHDDRGYGYLVPYNNHLVAGGRHGLFVRVDLSTFSTRDVTVIDLQEVSPLLEGFVGGFATTSHAYLVPYDRGGRHGNLVRVSLAMFNTSGVEWFNVAELDPGLKGFYGGFTDGAHAYYTPYNNGGYSGKLVRVSTSNFTLGGTEVLDLEAIDPRYKGFIGGFTDGCGYGYLTQYREASSILGTIILRVNLTSFGPGGVTELDLSYLPASDGVNSFRGGFADGVFLYVHSYSAGKQGVLVRIRLDDFSPSGVSIISLGELDTEENSLFNFGGSCTDGAYGVLAPYSRSKAVRWSVNPHSATVGSSTGL